MPVTTPGRAIGSTNRNEIVSRPKNLKRCSANASADPSSMAKAVAPSAALIESFSASRTSELSQASPNHFVESPGSGQSWMFDELNAYRQISSSGSQRKATTSTVQAARPIRMPRPSISAPSGDAGELLGRQHQARGRTRPQG